MFSFGLTSNGSGFEPLILLLTALFFEAVLGKMGLLYKFFRHPTVLMRNATRFFESRLNREKRSQMDRAIRGLLATLTIIAIAGAIGQAISWVGSAMIWGWLLELILVSSLISCRGLYDQVDAVKGALSETVDAGRLSLSRVITSDPWGLDKHGVARLAIETAARGLNSGLVAPTFWYLLFGMPGLIIYRTLTVMDDLIGYKSSRYRAYGLSAARLDDIANLVPARLSALFIVMAALFVPTASPLRALKTMWRDGGQSASLNTGWPVAAMAGAFALALGGPEKTNDKVTNKPWIGDGRAQATTADITKVLYLYSVASLVNAMWVGVIAVIYFSW